ncbi:MAG: hypothetical protein M3256_07075 [Actinomycetota bacterium]|nr:hypothetical protein [Actinomycetota bacterium]
MTSEADGERDHERRRKEGRFRRNWALLKSAPERRRLLGLARQRALAVAVSNTILLVVMLFLLPGYPNSKNHEGVISLFYIVEVAVVICCSFLYMGLGPVIEDLRHSLDPDGAEVPTAERTEVKGNPVYVFIFLCVCIAANFFAVGRVVNATGGITASPFPGFALTMLVLGQLLAIARVTRAIVGIFGVIFFFLMVNTDLFGHVDPHGSEGIEHLTARFLAVTLVSLLISLVVNDFVRKGRGKGGPGGGTDVEEGPGTNPRVDQ